MDTIGASATAIAISGISLVVAILSLSIAFLSFRSAGPRLQIRAIISKERLHVDIANFGRSDVSVSIGSVEFQQFHSPNAVPAFTLHSFIPTFVGEEMPFRLQSNSFEEWHASVPELITLVKRSRFGTVSLDVRAGKQKITAQIKLDDLSLKQGPPMDHRTMFSDIMMRRPF